MSALTVPSALKRGDRVVHEDRHGVVTVSRIERIERFRGFDDPSIVIEFVKLEGLDVMIGDRDELEVIA